MLSVQVVVLEQAGPVTALRRSYRLLRGYRGHDFSVHVGAPVLVGLASFGLDIPFQLAALALNQEGGASTADFGCNQHLRQVASSGLALPLLTGVLVLLCLDLSIRKEGMAKSLKAALQRAALTDSEF